MFSHIFVNYRKQKLTRDRNEDENSFSEIENITTGVFKNFRNKELILM